MTIYFTKLTVGYPDELKLQPEELGAWRLYVICAERRQNTSFLRSDIGDMAKADKISARTSLVNFSERTKAGFLLSDVYDSKQCHVAHTTKRGNPPVLVDVWRIWGSGKIRVYFMYLPDRRIVVLKISPKREQKLTAEQKSVLDGLVALVMDELNGSEFEAKEF